MWFKTLDTVTQYIHRKPLGVFPRYSMGNVGRMDIVIIKVARQDHKTCSFKISTYHFQGLNLSGEGKSHSSQRTKLHSVEKYSFILMTL